MRTLGRRGWRPQLWFLLGGALGATLAFAMAGLVALRYLGPAFGFKLSAIGLAALIGLATLGLLWLMVRLLLRPIQALAAYAGAASRPGPLPDRPAHYGTTEIHDMAASVVDMAEALKRREGSQRAFTDHVIHELKTPVSAIRAATELLADSPELAAPDRALVDQLASAAAQMTDQLAALRAVAVVREADHSGEARLGDVVAGLRTDQSDLEVVVEGEDALLPLAPDGLALVLGHLAANAAAHGATRLTLTASHDRLTVADNGPGISEGNRARVFDPFFTTRREAGGTGMGLYIVASLLAANRASIALEDGPGAVFTIRFA